MGNERGAAALLYVVMIAILLMLFAPVVLSMTTTGGLQGKGDRNMLVANHLAVTAMESLFDYLETHRSGDGDRDDFLLAYPGLLRQPDPFVLPDGTPVTIGMSWTGKGADKFEVTVTVMAGSGSTARSKQLTYEINAATPGSGGNPFEDPGLREPPDIGAGGIYVGGESNPGAIAGGGLIIAREDVREGIASYLEYFEQKATNALAAYQASALVCNDCHSKGDVVRFIEDHHDSASPLVVYLPNHIVVNEWNETFALGSPSQPVVLIFSNVTLNNKSAMTVYGDMFVTGSVTMNGHDSRIAIHSAGGLDGQLFVMGHFANKTTAHWHADGMIYAHQMTNTGNASLFEAQRLAVRDHLRISSLTTLQIATDILAGSIRVDGHDSKLHATAGDLLVENDFHSSTKSNVYTGGTMAVGGNFTNTGWQTVIETEGGPSVVPLITGPGAGSGDGTSAAGGWNPVRMK